MTQAYDVIAIGSGHNGLVAAAYLAAAGKKVLILERNEWFGGGVVTRPLTVPGFRHDQHSMAHIFIQGNPLLRNDDLGLKSRFGLRYAFPDCPMMSVFEDGSTLALFRDREKSVAEVAKFSQKDAEAFRRLSEAAAGFMPMLLGGLYSPPPPIGATNALMDQSREGRELWRLMQMSIHDMLEEWFEHPRVQMHFARIAGENLCSPDEKSTGFGVFVFLGFLEMFGFGVAIGGSGELTRALIDCIKAHGGEIVAGADVAQVTVKNGRAAGVVTADGREYEARDGVIGAIHPHDLGKMVEGVDPWVVKTAERTQITSPGCITIHAALNEPLRFRTRDPVKGVMIELLPNDYNLLRQGFDDLRYGGFPRCPLVGVGSLSMHDPSRVPEGKAVMHAWDYVTYDHPEGRNWDEAKQDYAQVMLNHMGKFIENIDAGNIIATHIDSPVDMERTSSTFRKGDLHGVAATTYQSNAWRPTPELGRGTVPGVDRLYLVGPFQYPGGGVFGAGRAAAMTMFDDLKMDFGKVSKAPA